MKILFIADIHIKLNQKNVPIDWAKNRYKLFNDKISKMQESADLVILGGDIFDKMPSMEELEVYFSMLQVFNKPTYVISGNHESVKKNTTFLTSLKEVSCAINSNINIIDDFFSLDNIDFIPYNKLKEFVSEGKVFTGNVLVTHVRGEIPPHVKPEIPLELLERWDIVLAGDLHSYENSQRNIIYPGSPMATSFHRNPVDNGVIVFDSDKLTHTWISLGLPQLLRKTINVGEEMEPTTYDHTIYEVSGDLAELSSVTNNALLDKKISTRMTDVTLMLEPDMTLKQELKEYLEYILVLKPDNIDSAMRLFESVEAKIND
jgi:DNA repair exonuclease SbcCD nuclease subunit